MRDGFLGYNTSFMLDAVVCALLLVVPVLAWSIYLVKVKHKYQLHKQLQLGVGLALLLAVTAFEVDLHLVQGGWENVVAKREQPLSTTEMKFVTNLLRVHLIFAGTTPILWGVTIGFAFKRFPNPPVPNDHSPLHKKLAWLSTIDLMLTSVTGIVFYYFAFVA